jgi:hypothetical protein
MRILRACVVCALAVVPRVADAGCTPIAGGEPRVMQAAATADTLSITFLGHASFLIETPGGVRAVTDYNGYNVPADPPDIATMNHAHSTHYTDYPDPRIPHVLHGWREDGRPAMIDLTVGDLHVANLPTNIRDWQVHQGLWEFDLPVRKYRRVHRASVAPAPSADRTGPGAARPYGVAVAPVDASMP